MDASTNASLFIGSMDGKLIYEAPINASGQTEVNLNGYSKGVYWIAVKDLHGALLYRNIFNRQ